MLYITGDTHGFIDRFYGISKMDDDKFTEDDYLIVSGDFGFVFQTRGTMAYLEEREALDSLEEKPYTILFVDGNHENFDRINHEFPTESWKGGRIHRIRKNVIHLMRGHVFDIDGKKIFTMGGGYSRDKASRTEGFSWWPEEMPSNAEYRQATASLKECDNKVDLIITHTAPQKLIYAMARTPDPHEMELTGFLEWVHETVDFKHWYFGHWHTDLHFTGMFDRFTATHFDIYPVE